MIRRCCIATLILLTFSASSLCSDEPRADAFGDRLPLGVVARLGSVRWRSTNWGYNTEAGIFTPNGERFISWGLGQAIEIFDVATGRKRQSFSHKHGFYPGESVALAPDGKSLVAASVDRDVRIWDLATGRETNGWAAGGKFNEETRKWAHSVVAAGFLGSKPVYAQVDEPEKSAKGDKVSPPVLCDARTGARLYTFSGDNWIGHRLVFSPDGKTIAVMDTKNAVHLFDSRTIKQIHQWDAGGGPYSAMRFSRDGSAWASSIGANSNALRDIFRP